MSFFVDGKKSTSGEVSWLNYLVCFFLLLFYLSLFILLYCADDDALDDADFFLSSSFFVVVQATPIDSTNRLH